MTKRLKSTDLYEMILVYLFIHSNYSECTHCTEK